MNEQNSLRIAKLAGEILTRGHADIKTIMHSPERALGQKLDAVADLVESMPPGEPRETDVEPQSRGTNVELNSILTAQDRILRHRVLQMAVTFLLRSPQVKLSKTALDSMQTALNNYTTYVTEGGSDHAITDDFLKRAETLYKELRSKILKFIRDAAKSPFVEDRPQTTGGPSSNAAQQINAPQAPPVITNEQYFNRLDIQQLTDYIENNYNGQFDFDKHNSVEDVRNFAKTVWHNKTAATPTYTAPTPQQAMLSPLQQSLRSSPNHIWEERLRQMFPENVSLPDSNDEEPFIEQRKRRRRRVPPLVYTSDENYETPLGSNEPEDEPRRRKRREPSPASYKTPPKTNNESPTLSSEEDEPNHERERERRREEDKNYLRLKALELSKYANVNERMEKIVQVTKAMQKTYDYCNCKTTIGGTPDAATFVNLLRRLNTYNLSHVEMTVNFYELLYPLTLYRDESNRIIGYIFAAAKYFQNCAKNFVQMRAEFNVYGPFAQIESMVMFVIKFNFLCDLQAFFGKIDSLPTLGQPNISIHTVLVMRDKIVKKEFNALQYATTLKTDNRRDPKHLQRLIQLMNADFNIM
ncbi:VP80 protein [Choristoneura diversana nucleopolyhedrovirus]|nr:VP80 protein [Choristoneura diversana nucleopolyhedrovirus]